MRERELAGSPESSLENIPQRAWARSLLELETDRISSRARVLTRNHARRILVSATAPSHLRRAVAAPRVPHGVHCDANSVPRALEETSPRALQADHHGGDGRLRALGDDDSRRRLVRAILASARERLASPPATRAASAPRGSPLFARARPRVPRAPRGEDRPRRSEGVPRGWRRARIPVGEPGKLGH